MHWITTTGGGSLVPSIQRGDDTDAMNGNAVMYDIGKILTIGGAQNYASGPASKRAYVIDIAGPAEATVRRTRNDMQFARSMANSVVLPNGEVVVIGGQTSVKLFVDDNRVLEAEIWNPATESFRTLSRPMLVPRTYHSVALLLPDGRVWVSGMYRRIMRKAAEGTCGRATTIYHSLSFPLFHFPLSGGGLCGRCCCREHQDYEILTPPYLLNAVDGTPVASRPVIQSVSPTSVRAGGTMTVQLSSSAAMAAAAHTFALVRLSAVTHTVNNDQRRIPLAVTSQTAGGGSFTVQIPNNANVAMTGVYFLFAMNDRGVPSVATTVTIAL
jgi:galactose oxidase